MNAPTRQSASGPASDPQPIDSPTYWVVCLCAAWCGLCKDYRKIFEKVASHTGGRFVRARFAWVDIEDEADWVGDLDIETFPTLLIADTQGLLFMGSLTPHGETLSRLLQSLQEPGAKRLPHTALSQMLCDELPHKPAFWVEPGTT